MRRVLIIFGGVAVLALLLLPATGQAQQGTPSTTAASPTPSPTPAPGGASATTAPAAGEEEVDGRQLYFNNCAACHGPDFNGTSNGPSLREVGGAAAVDWVLRSGRMPIAAPDQVPQRGPARFNPDEIEAITRYVGSAVGDTQVPEPEIRTDQETLNEGRELYQENCAACHGVNGAGAAIGGGYDAPSLLPVDGRTVAEAMKIGPGKMPVFAGEQYPPEDVSKIASYVLTLGTGDNDKGGFPIGGRGPVAEGFVGWVIGLGLMVFAARLIGTRTERKATDGHDDRVDRQG